MGLPVLFLIKPIGAYLALAVFPFSMLYPLAKRFTYYPQLVLGSVFNFGLFVGFSSISGSLSLQTVLPFYIAGVLWTLIYDTVYALPDMKDDLKVGVKGLALVWKENTLYYSWICNWGLGLSLAIGGYLNGFGLAYY